MYGSHPAIAYCEEAGPAQASGRTHMGKTIAWIRWSGRHHDAGDVCRAGLQGVRATFTSRSGLMQPATGRNGRPVRVASRITGTADGARRLSDAG